MIDNSILDEILPVPELETLKDETVAELQESGFVITNFHPGGVFYTLLMIVLRLRIEFVRLLRTILNQMFISHATGIWLDLRAADFSKARKQAQKARGYITLTRAEDQSEAVKIKKGHVFKTERDINGEELRYISLEASVLQKGAQTVDVLVEAELEGSRYNVPEGQITRSLTYLDGVGTIRNGSGWIVREGSDSEPDESFRTRCQRSWSELAGTAIHDTYVNVCEAVPGVLYVTVDDQHPRGQGTIDVIVTSEAGQATDALLEAVCAACETICSADDDVLVKSAEIVKQPVALTVTAAASLNQGDLTDRITTAIEDLLRLKRGGSLNELTHADIIYKVKRELPEVRNVTVTAPAGDLFLDSGKVILPGTISVTIQGV